MSRENSALTNNVLLIASHYPPDPRVGGVMRVAKLVKYLPALGWNPIVITAKADSVNDEADVLFKEVAHIGEVHRTARLDVRQLFHGAKRVLIRVRSMMAGRRGGGGTTQNNTGHVINGKPGGSGTPLASLFLVPDYLVIWSILASLKSLQLVLFRKIDVIYSTSPLQSGLLVAYLVKKIGRIPWVVEMRDPWTTNPMGKKRAWKILDRIESKLEEKVLMAADKVVVINSNFIAPILEKFPSVDKVKFVVIPNGFDLEDFEGIAPIRSGKFSIVHAGQFYVGRSPLPFLEALSRLSAQNPDLKTIWCVRLVGASASLQPVLEQLGISGIVEIIDSVPHDVSLSYITGADMLLLVPGPGRSTMTGKIFEYIAARKPIIALAGEGVVHDLLTANGIGVVVPPDNVEEIAAGLFSLYDAIQSNRFVYPDVSKLIDQYDRRNIAKQCAEVMDSICISPVER